MYEWNITNKRRNHSDIQAAYLNTVHYVDNGYKDDTH